jgi:pantothenate kinase type III
MRNWLVLDVGNTHTVGGLYDPEAGRLAQHVRFRTDPQATSDEYRAQLSFLFSDARGLWTGLERVIVSSVVPSLEGVIKTACGKLPCPSFPAFSSRATLDANLISTCPTPLNWAPIAWPMLLGH